MVRYKLPINDFHNSEILICFAYSHSVTSKVFQKLHDLSYHSRLDVEAGVKI